VTKHLTYVLTIAISLGATAMLATSNRTVSFSTSLEAHFAADGAFHDGLYLGKLAAQHGQPLRPAIGRWSANRDRAMFEAGYRIGYGEFRRVSHQGGGRRHERPSTNLRASQRRA
jgi:hypothetical protein